MSFYTSLSGLQASQAELSAISHNLANISTNGFKKSRAEFADIIASNMSTSPTKMIGSGTVLQANRQQFGQGNLIQSTSNLDLAVSGDGFFAVKPRLEDGKVNFTRNGAFAVNAEHYVTDANGSYLQVFPVDGSGAVVATGLDGAKSLRLPETSGEAVATRNVGLSLNLSSASSPIAAAKPFDRFDASTYNQSTSTTIYDANGNAQTMVTYFRRETTPTATDPNSSWSLHSYVGDTELAVGGATSQTMTFDGTGKLTAPAAPITFDPVTPSGANAPQTLTLDFGAFTVQSSAPFSVASRTQDGAAIGQLEGVTVDEEGMVKASFSNGDIQALGKVMLASFSNPSGLRQLGSSYWSATGVSGEAKVGTANAAGLGKLMSGTIERSNVDITEELVGLIAAQRNFQANAKALDTASQISQTIFNIRS